MSERHLLKNKIKEKIKKKFRNHKLIEKEIEKAIDTDIRKFAEYLLESLKEEERIIELEDSENEEEMIEYSRRLLDKKEENDE